jgi:hypothetical protein
MTSASYFRTRGIAAGALILASLSGAAALAAETAPRPIIVAADDSEEKEAFEAAKDLGTVEAWDAFLSHYSAGFRADLARAYVKKLAGAPPAAGPPPAPMPTVSANIAPGETTVGVSALNVTRVTYAGGEFIKTGLDSWIEQSANGQFSFQETWRSVNGVEIWDTSRTAHILLDVRSGAILYAQGGAKLGFLYPIAQAFSSPAMARSPSSDIGFKAPPVSPPKVKVCSAGYSLVKGKCLAKKKSVETDKNGFEVKPWKKPGCGTWQQQCNAGNNDACAKYETTCQVN